VRGWRILAVGGACCAVLAIVATALAAQPNNGALYVGKLAAVSEMAESCSVPKGGTGRGAGTNAGGHKVCFEISPNGASLTDFSGPYVQACGNLGVATLSYPTHAEVSNGRFVVKLIVPAHSKNGITVSGRFAANGRVHGIVKVATQCLLPPNFNSGPIKHKSYSWSGSSEPSGAGSAYCFEHGQFSQISTVRTTCQVAYRAMTKGKFTAVTATAMTTIPPPTFTTPGWKCTNTTASGGYTCTKAKGSFSFVRSDI
jgi:hypothetical protein